MAETVDKFIEPSYAAFYTITSAAKKIDKCIKKATNLNIKVAKPIFTLVGGITLISGEFIGGLAMIGRGIVASFYSVKGNTSLKAFNKDIKAEEIHIQELSNEFQESKNMLEQTKQRLQVIELNELNELPDKIRNKIQQIRNSLRKLSNLEEDKAHIKSFLEDKYEEIIILFNIVQILQNSSTKIEGNEKKYQRFIQLQEQFSKQRDAHSFGRPILFKENEYEDTIMKQIGSINELKTRLSNQENMGINDLNPFIKS